MSELERYKEALQDIIEMVNPAFQMPDKPLNEVFKRANEALNPPVEYEEVEIVAAKIIYESGTTLICASVEAAEKEVERVKGINIHNERNYDSACKYRIVELKGVDKRPKPKKVKRREEILSELVKVSGGFPDGVKFYAEWEEE